MEEQQEAVTSQGEQKGAEHKLVMREKEEKRLKNSLGAKCNGLPVSH